MCRRRSYVLTLDCVSGGFDFVLLFEETILSILPLILILSIAPFRIIYLWRKQTKVRISKLLYIKLVCYKDRNHLCDASLQTIS